MADQDELSGGTLDMSKSQPLPSAPENDFSGVKLDLSKSTPISGSATAPKPMSAQEEHDRYALTHPEAGQLPSGAAMPADHTIRDTPSSYAQAALTRTPSTSATNIPAMRPEDIKTAQSIAPRSEERRVGKECRSRW